MQTRRSEEILIWSFLFWKSETTVIEIQAYYQNSAVKECDSSSVLASIYSIPEAYYSAFSEEEGLFLISLSCSPKFFFAFFYKCELINMALAWILKLINGAI